jgi:selenide, water dikinase
MANPLEADMDPSPSAKLPSLTSLASGGGCACKLPSKDLHRVLAGLPRRSDPALLFGAGLGDDAAIYRLSDSLAIVQTVDFFAPLIDDPRAYGRIAAANALSDVYALGARPLTALNIVGFPAKVLPLSILEEILAGGAEACAEAGVTVVGGHTIDDAEPKFGLAVTGVVDPTRAILNSGAKPGDKLLLSKALGTGIVANAIKKGHAEPEAIAEAVASMCQLNRVPSELMVRHRATACTDVTGFGLLSHLQNLLLASGVAARLRSNDVPVLRGARLLAEAGNFPGGTRRNLAAAADFVKFPDDVPERVRLILADAQTSGGLLIACPPGQSAALCAALVSAGFVGAQIGEIVAGVAGTIQVA